MIKPEIIPVTQSEIHDLVEMRIAFAIELSPPQPREAIDRLREQLTAYFTQSLSDGGSFSFIARLENRMAGIGSVHVRTQPGNFKNPSGKWGYVMNMYTVPECRRKGICKAILIALEKEAISRGISALELHATHAGSAVYEQNGFEKWDQPTYRKVIGS